MRIGIALLALLPLVAALAPAADAGDRHAGYYYPAVTSEEVYTARSRLLEGAGRKARIGFVIGMTAAQQQRPYPPRYAIFAKGDEAEKLIIVGLDAASFRTLFRARAVLAQLTAQARTSELFAKLAVEDYFTFFDLVHMLGFAQLTVSDGESYAHQVTFK